MGYRIERQDPPAEAIRRMACEQIDKAIDEIHDSDLDRHETVHQVRKRCKKLRGLVRLVRPCMEEVYQHENAWYRDSARALSNIRDAHALIECCEDLLQRFDRTFAPATFAELYQKLILYRDRSAATVANVEERLQVFLDRMKEGRARLKAWPLKEEGFDLLQDGLNKTYGRGRRAMTSAYESTTVAAFHEWRKRVKYHWYHARILENVWPDLMSSYRHTLKQLSDDLGDDHDLAVLQQTLIDDPQSFGTDEMIAAFTALARQRQEELRSHARPLGARIYAETPNRFGKRICRYWEAWRDFPRDG
ncbi:MAG: CHAD domain-containing protein [Desulfuromonadales bacterium]|jgi:CHAD domain-containing protein